MYGTLETTVFAKSSHVNRRSNPSYSKIKSRFPDHHSITEKSIYLFIASTTLKTTASARRCENAGTRTETKITLYTGSLNPIITTLPWRIELHHVKHHQVSIFVVFIFSSVSIRKNVVLHTPAARTRIQHCFTRPSIAFQRSAEQSLAEK